MEPVTPSDLFEDQPPSTMTDRELLEATFVMVRTLTRVVANLLERFEPLLKKAENRKKIHDTITGVRHG